MKKYVACANPRTVTDCQQAAKFGAVSEEDDDDLQEEGMLESMLDKVEPYGMFKNTLMSMKLQRFEATVPNPARTTIRTALAVREPH
jgi:hypothetical protein